MSEALATAPGTLWEHNSQAVGAAAPSRREHERERQRRKVRSSAGRPEFLRQTGLYTSLQASVKRYQKSPVFGVRSLIASIEMKQASRRDLKLRAFDSSRKWSSPPMAAADACIYEIHPIMANTSQWHPEQAGKEAKGHNGEEDLEHLTQTQEPLQATQYATKPQFTTCCCQEWQYLATHLSFKRKGLQSPAASGRLLDALRSKTSASGCW